MHPPKALGGVLDLRDWDFAAHGSVPLIGEWDFFPGALLRGPEAREALTTEKRVVPDRWTSRDPAGTAAGIGAGTYRLRVLLPSSIGSAGGLGILYTTVSTAFELDANDILVARAGHPALNASLAVSAYKPGVAVLPGASGELILVARVSNYEYRAGGMWRPFFLGRADSLIRRHWADTTGALALAASLAILAVLSMLLSLGTGLRREFVSFFGFALSSALRSIVTGSYAIVELLPGLRFSELIRLEYLSAYTAYPLALIFFIVLFPEDVKAGLNKILLTLCAAFFVLIPFAPLRILTSSIQPYYALAAVIVVYIVAIQVRALAYKRSGAVSLFIGSLALAASSVNDILFSSFLVSTGNLFSYGMLFFIGSQMVAMARQYRSMQIQLRATLGEKDLLLKEVHHRVKNSLQIVSSIAALQSNRTKDPAALEAYRSIRERIRAISLVHEKLYSLEAENDIDLGEYAHDLSAQLSESYGIEGSRIDIEADRLMLPSDLCSDVGLIMTELISNAYKYALQDNLPGQIHVRLAHMGSELLLSVADEGPGFPEGIAIEGTTTLGFRLISVLAKKRSATVELRNEKGALVEIRFPLEKTQPAPKPEN